MIKDIFTNALIAIALFAAFNIMVLAIGEFGEPGMNESIEKNISIAQEKYAGNAEDALIAYMLDTTNTFNDRSHIAIWTLGQLKSVKALPIINELYNDDPSGVTCKGRHDKVICQRVLHNAIVAIESDRELYSGLNRE